MSGVNNLMPEITANDLASRGAFIFQRFRPKTRKAMACRLPCTRRTYPLFTTTLLPKIPILGRTSPSRSAIGSAVWWLSEIHSSLLVRPPDVVAEAPANRIGSAAGRDRHDERDQPRIASRQLRAGGRFQRGDDGGDHKPDERNPLGNPYFPLPLRIRWALRCRSSGQPP